MAWSDAARAAAAEMRKRGQRNTDGKPRFSFGAGKVSKGGKRYLKYMNRVRK